VRLVTGWNTLRKNPELIAACGRLAMGRGTKGSEKQLQSEVWEASRQCRGSGGG
jgi:hypothetical protein